MFSCSSKLRTTEIPNQSQRSISPFNTTVHHHSSYFNIHSNLQIETNKIIPNELMKSNVIKDNNYNMMKNEWRKVETTPIVGGLQKEIKNCGQFSIKNLNLQTNAQNKVLAESILYQINSETRLNKEQMLYAFKCMLDGHECILKKMKETNVSLEKTFVNYQGEVKVWVNECFESNNISGEVLNRESLIVEKIFLNICTLSKLNENKLSDFVEYVKTSMKRNGKWTFSYMRGLIRSYSDCMKLKTVNKIIKEARCDRKTLTLKDSHVSNSSLNRTRIRHASIFEMTKINSNSPHNIDSSTQLNEKNREKSQNSKDSHKIPKLGSFKSISNTEAPTCKAIKGKESNIFKRSKHSNSISGFENILKDSIIEEGRPSLRVQLQTKKSLEKEHQMETKSFHNIFHKMAIPEALDESSQTTTPHYLQTPERSPRLTGEEKRNPRLSIKSQFGFSIDKKAQKTECKPKESLISTTNQTNISGFVRKSKESYLIVSNDEREELRTASKDRYEKIQPSIENKKIIGSYTHSSYPSNLKDLGKLIKKFEQSNIIPTKEQKEYIEESLPLSARLELSKHVVSYKIIEEEENDVLNIKVSKAFQSTQNDQADWKTLKTSESYENLADSKVHSKPLNNQIQHLLGMNKNLTFSTYIDSNSEKAISHQNSSKKLKELQETLEELFQANEKQKEIFQINNWTKKLNNLLENKVKEEMKESFNFGNEESV